MRHKVTIVDAGRSVRLPTESCRALTLSGVRYYLENNNPESISELTVQITCGDDYIDRDVTTKDFNDVLPLPLRGMGGVIEKYYGGITIYLDPMVLRWGWPVLGLYISYARGFLIDYTDDTHTYDVYYANIINDIDWRVNTWLGMPWAEDYRVTWFLRPEPNDFGTERSAFGSLCCGITPQWIEAGSPIMEYVSLATSRVRELALNILKERVRQ